MSSLAYFLHEKKEVFPSLDFFLYVKNILHDTYFLWKPFLFEQPVFFLASARELFFPATLIQRNLPWLRVFRQGGWSSTILEALGSAVISWLSEHNGWKLSYYLSMLSKGKGSCGAERPRKTLALIGLKGVGQPSQIMFSQHAILEWKERERESRGGGHSEWVRNGNIIGYLLFNNTLSQCVIETTSGAWIHQYPLAQHNGSVKRLWYQPARSHSSSLL